MNYGIKTFFRKKIFPSVGIDNTLARESWLRKVLSNLPDDARILDAGAGSQQHSKFCSHLKYVSQDFAEYDGTGDGKGLQTGSYNYGNLDIISDITNIPEPDESFDAIMCTEVLEHLPCPEKAISEFSRLLKPDGILILTAPFCSLTHYAPYHYCSGFNKYWYEYHLNRNKFHYIQMFPNGNFFEFIAQEINRLSLMSDRYSKSSPRSIERLSIFIIKWMLFRLSTKDNGSSEVLCYGYHVTAKKCSSC